MQKKPNASSRSSEGFLYVLVICEDSEKDPSSDAEIRRVFQHSSKDV